MMLPARTGRLARVCRGEALARPFARRERKVPGRSTSSGHGVVGAPGGVRPPRLASLEWLRAAANVCLVGPAGTGKSHLLIALRLAALLHGGRPRRRRHRGLADNSVGRLIVSVLRANLVIVDELGSLRRTTRWHPAAVPLRRRRVRAAIALDRVALAARAEGRFIPEHTTAVSLLDRLLHQATVVVTRRRERPHARGSAPGRRSPIGQLTTVPGWGLFVATSGTSMWPLTARSATASIGAGIGTRTPPCKVIAVVRLRQLPAHPHLRQAADGRWPMETGEPALPEALHGSGGVLLPRSRSRGFNAPEDP